MLQQGPVELKGIFPVNYMNNGSNSEMVIIKFVISYGTIGKDKAERYV